MALQTHIFKVSELCSLLGVKEAVISPGSRSAALSLAFSRNPGIKIHHIADERSAAYFALGLSSVSRIPTVLICTSGTAALQYAAAVSEAYFQEIPLLILTADRPPEWIHQYDGQTIFQQNIYGKHVKRAYQLEANIDFEHGDWYLERTINEAVMTSMQAPMGPVHINVPIREPFYPDKGESYTFGLFKPKLVKDLPLRGDFESKEIKDIFLASQKIMFVIGQQDEGISELLDAFEDKVVVVADITANVHVGIKTQDALLKTMHLPDPDLLVTFGKSLMSKSLKTFLRAVKIKNHVHVQDNPLLIDPLKSITHKVRISARGFLEVVAGFELQSERSFIDQWYDAEKNTIPKIENYLAKLELSELKAFALIFTHYQDAAFHIGNSMPIRYANILQFLKKSKNSTYANRGTSGIDGTLSTAVGQASATNVPFVCVLGDVSFFYDSNAMFINSIPANLKMIMINNAGGNIFRIIDGPSQTAELEDIFVGKQPRNAKNLCMEAGIKYLPVHNLADLNGALVESTKPESCLIEVFVDGEKDAIVLKELYSTIL